MRHSVLLLCLLACTPSQGSSSSSGSGSATTTGSTTDTAGSSTGGDATSSGATSSGSSSSSSSANSSATSSASSSSGGTTGGRPAPPCDPSTSTALPDGGCECDSHRCRNPFVCGYTTYCCLPPLGHCDPLDGGICCGGVCDANGTCSVCSSLSSSCNTDSDCCQGRCSNGICQL